MSIKLPIAERFHSLQGEGQWVGTPMHFIRLAGCSVGHLSLANPLLKTGAHAWQCHTYDGRPFMCDTDFNIKERIDIDDLLADTPEHHICITGGEPLVHRASVEVFIEATRPLGKQVHIETSGTIDWVPFGNTWMSVSPKHGCLESMCRRADEIKLLVDENFNLDKLPHYCFIHPKVYLQPINNETSLNMENVKRCLDIQKDNPKFRLSIQLHKVLGLR